ncbi:MAG: TetR/AcrR family transcriptional regulator [Nevskia sp.]|nr:TetR/AcrR family transcriptional regulator [Nevskia sp.]
MLNYLIPVTARGEATRRKLLNAAETEFGAKGFHSASVSSITTQAGVGQGTFYLYFRSKEEIFANLVGEIGQHLRQTIARVEIQVSDRMDIERRSLEAFLGFAQEHPGLYRIVQEAQFVDEDAFRDFYERLADGYGQALHGAAARGEILPGDAEVRAWSLLGIGHFLGMRYCLWDGRLPEPRVVDEVMQLIGHGIAPRAELQSPQ